MTEKLKTIKTGIVSLGERYDLALYIYTGDVNTKKYLHEDKNRCRVHHITAQPDGKDFFRFMRAISKGRAMKGNFHVYFNEEVFDMRLTSPIDCDTEKGISFECVFSDVQDNRSFEPWPGIYVKTV